MAAGSVLEEQPSAELYAFSMCSLSVVYGRRAEFLLKLSPVPFSSNRCCETAPSPTARCVCPSDLLLSEMLSVISVGPVYDSAG